MFAARKFQKHCLKTLTSIILNNPSKDVSIFNPNNFIRSSITIKDESFNWFNGCRAMSTSRGRSMRSKVESRMQKEAGKTLREIRRAKKLRKKLMTDEERLIYNLRRAKKKVALLLQKLKKYELPELPPPRHDPEILTPEQLQAYKKVGFRNKNYVPVGVRGVFGGVVQNMHLHWKFHETVQVCCDNFPKEKIKEMATMLARLSGGIVVNIHNVKTIIMFRGRNYRQPKNLIPINTLTKRKALFKARFEQALESQKLNIKKIEQQLRRMGVNPDDPVAMASIQRVASTFFNAIDKKEGSPYVFHGNKQRGSGPASNLPEPEPEDDSDQEELDKFIAEIEDAADKEWEAEEEAEKEEISRIRYLNKEDFGGGYRRSVDRHRIDDSEDEDNHDSAGHYDSDHGGDSDELDGPRRKINVPKVEKWKRDRIIKGNNNDGFKRISEAKFRGKLAEEDCVSDEMLSDLEGTMWGSDDEKETGPRESAGFDYRSSSDEDEDYQIKRDTKWGNDDSDKDHNRFNVFGVGKGRQIKVSPGTNNGDYKRLFKGLSSDSEVETLESEDGGEFNSRTLRTGTYDYNSNGEVGDFDMDKKEDGANRKRMKTRKQMDETWDSD
ncbi:hypothetical protein LguiA_019635 [Lonicera macranthoides]